MSNFKTPTHNDHPRPKPSPTPASTDLRHAARHAEQTRRDAEQCAKLASLPVRPTHAAGIDVGDASHWVCVESTADNSATVREFPVHTPGLRQLVAWLQQCAVTTVALEASGVYGHVLLWIQRLHKHGLLPAIFQPDEATQTLRDYVRQRANYAEQVRERLEKQLQRRARELGFELKKIERAVVPTVTQVGVAGSRRRR